MIKPIAEGKMRIFFYFNVIFRANVYVSLTFKSKEFIKDNGFIAANELPL